jgi:hypothetical protein
LKEFYDDQRGRYQAPTELEMRVYHRLIHIRDQRERPDNIPSHITEHPVFKLTTDFRLHIQKKSMPITKSSALVVDEDGMRIFGELADHLREEGNVVMIYLVACILERLFGVETIDDIDSIKGGLQDKDIIDGISSGADGMDEGEYEEESLHTENDEGEYEDQEHEEMTDLEHEEDQTDDGQGGSQVSFNSAPTSVFSGMPSAFQPPPASSVPTPAVIPSAFANLTATQNAFSTPTFRGSVFGGTSTSTGSAPPKSVFGGSVFGAPIAPSVFGSGSSGPSLAAASEAPTVVVNNNFAATHSAASEPHVPIKPASTGIFSTPLPMAPPLPASAPGKYFIKSAYLHYLTLSHSSNSVQASAFIWNY